MKRIGERHAVEPHEHVVDKRSSDIGSRREIRDDAGDDPRGTKRIVLTARRLFDLCLAQHAGLAERVAAQIVPACVHRDFLRLRQGSRHSGRWWRGRRSRSSRRARDDVSGRPDLTEHQAMGRERLTYADHKLNARRCGGRRQIRRYEVGAVDDIDAPRSQRFEQADNRLRCH